jgi:hypothetical protein
MKSLEQQEADNEAQAVSQTQNVHASSKLGAAWVEVDTKPSQASVL